MSNTVEEKLINISEDLAVLRSKSRNFDALVAEIETEIKSFISRINAQKSYNPKPITDYKFKTFVSAVPITFEEQECLINYLTYKYLYTGLMGGDYFIIKKRWFLPQYKLQTKYTYYGIDDF